MFAPYFFINGIFPASFPFILVFSYITVVSSDRTRILGVESR